MGSHVSTTSAWRCPCLGLRRCDILYKSKGISRFSYHLHLLMALFLSDTIILMHSVELPTTEAISQAVETKSIRKDVLAIWVDVSNVA